MSQVLRLGPAIYRLSTISRYRFPLTIKTDYSDITLGQQLFELLLA
jgi:hypothetical protein